MLFFYTVYCLLFTVYCLLFTVYCLLFTEFLIYLFEISIGQGVFSHLLRYGIRFGFWQQLPEGFFYCF
jgi:hypothetical protein